MITFRENEKVYLIKRRHRIVLLREIAFLKLIFFIIFVSAITILFISPPWPDWLIKFIPELSKIEIRYLLLFLSSILFLILWGVIFAIIAYYYLDCWIVTSERTIHTELIGFFRRTISTVPHEQIQDISIDVHGILPTILKYGDLHIQTAGKFREFVFRQIPNPYKTKEIIFKAKKEFSEQSKKSEENL